MSTENIIYEIELRSGCAFRGYKLLCGEGESVSVLRLLDDDEVKKLATYQPAFSKRFGEKGLTGDLVGLTCEFRYYRLNR